MNLILLVVLLLLVLGAFGGGYTGHLPGQYAWPGGGLGLVLLIVILVILFR